MDGSDNDNSGFGGGPAGATGASTDAVSNSGSSSGSTSGSTDYGTFDLSANTQLGSSMTFGDAAVLGAGAVAAIGAAIATSGGLATGFGVAAAAVAIGVVDLANNGPISTTIDAITSAVGANPDFANAAAFSGMVSAAEPVGPDTSSGGGGMLGDGTPWVNPQPVPWDQVMQDSSAYGGGT